MPRKVIERGQQANQARDAAMAAAGMEVEETTAIDFYLDRLKTDITESPGRVLDVATNFVAAVPGLLGDAQRVLNPKTGAPEGVRKLPTSSDIAEDMGASGEGYGAILGQLLSPLSPADVKLALGAGGALLGYMGVAGQGKKLPRALEAMRGGPAYHGTPHKFDQFDLEKIGTGEGAQAYGHGLYFAENPGVAKSYQTNVSTIRNPDLDIDLARTFEFKGKTFDTNMPTSEVMKLPVEERAAYAMMGEGGEPSAARALADIDEFGDDLGVKQHLESLLANPERIEFPKPQYGHLYEVDIPDETIDKMLDWDAPLSEQRDKLSKLPQDFLNEIEDDMGVPIESLSVEQLLDEIGRTADISTPEGASDFLNMHGIPGIRYYDGSSRGGAKQKFPKLAEEIESLKVKRNHANLRRQSPMSVQEELKNDTLIKEIGESINRKEDELAERFAQEGTRNIVVFNPDDIKSVKRDGELVYEAAKPTTSGSK
jgi:hypothetical protein